MITSWSSKKQATVSLSSTEAEYIATSECFQEAMFTQSLIKELTEELRPAVIYVDNQQVSARTKDIDVRHHFTRNCVAVGRLNIRFKRSEDNTADIMTQHLPRDLNQKHADVIRKGTMTCWREDVKNELSVKHFSGQPTDANETDD
jgi:hypothetical protein